MAPENDIIAGGSFLIEQPPPHRVFTPEDFDDEARSIAEVAADFAEKQVVPKLEALEAGEHHLGGELLKEAGELGLLAADVPEPYGGLGLDKATTTLMTEMMARGGAFAVTFSAHTGIGTLPVVFFGTEEQKERYLPALASGEKIAAYALTEPDAGSDALGAKTTAVLSDDGQHYVLDGQKLWITNSGFADLYVLYAKIDGEHFTAFLVDADSEGLTTGAEELKMGIKGSSTRALFLDKVKVPANNVLGEIGRGHIVAFNTLNIGRWKLAAGCVGGCKRLMEVSVSFAKERHQFGRSILEFPLIQQKLASMAAYTYALESMAYRTSGLFDDTLSRVDQGADDAGRQTARAIAEYAVEASINKVFGSEALDYVVDEAVQIHGGYGYMQEYEVERAYRDSRINRIFEGTNEINRMLVPGTLLRRAMKGELPLMAAIQELQKELTSFSPPVDFGAEPSSPLAAASRRLEGARKATLMVAGLGVQKYMEKAEDEQEFLAGVADMCIELFAIGSALLRAEKAYDRDAGSAEIHGQLTRLYAEEGFTRLEAAARKTLAGIEEGDNLTMQLALLRRLLRAQPENTKELGRSIAAKVAEAGGYPLK